MFTSTSSSLRACSPRMGMDMSMPTRPLRIDPPVLIEDSDRHGLKRLYRQARKGHGLPAGSPVGLAIRKRRQQSTGGGELRIQIGEEEVRRGIGWAFPMEREGAGGRSQSTECVGPLKTQTQSGPRAQHAPWTPTTAPWFQLRSCARGRQVSARPRREARGRCIHPSGAAPRIACPHACTS